MDIAARIILEKIEVGPQQTNCYLLGCQKTSEALIIDPGDDYPEIEEAIQRKELSPKLIVNTHGHIDHIGADGRFKLPIWIHKLDEAFLNDPMKNLSAFVGSSGTFPSADRLLEDKDQIKIGQLSLEVMHTPGHTPGGICLKCDKIVFTGDTLFCGGVGRTDFSYSSEKDLFKSIKEKLLVLDDETTIYPGHGPSSTIGEEKCTNPFL